jgi:hypothetical protein
MSESHQTEERRSGKDRRKGPTNPLTRASINGSRLCSRRKEDLAIHFYVDRYGRKAALTFLSAILLSTSDAFLTLRLTCAGADELNPIMLFFLQKGPIPFLLAKYAITGSALIFLLIHKNYRVFSGRIAVKSILLAVPILYTVLVLYELVLLRGCAI